VVDVGDEARRRVEQRIRRLVETTEPLLGNRRHRAPCTSGRSLALCCGKLRARRGARVPSTQGVLPVRRALRVTEQRSMAMQIAPAPPCGPKVRVRFYLQTMRILVVEDERKVASFLRQGLQEEGHAVETAADGAAALDLLLEGQGYDLVVLDLMLPKRDGFD